MKNLMITVVTLLTSLAAHGDDYRNEKALIEAWLSAQILYDRVPGLSVAMVHDQELAWSGAFGYADLENGTPARPDTLYGICSISKLFTGVAVMQLRDQGKYRLDQPIGELLPWYSLQQSYDQSPSVTLRALLSHSSGLPRESDYPYWTGPDFTFPSREMVIGKLSGQSTLYPADRYFQYSNLGLTLAGEVVVEQSGQAYDDYVREHILTPLGLGDTDTGFPSDQRASRIATGYGYPGRGQQLKVMPRYDANAITPAAGFASTALDLGKFAAWQFRALDGNGDGVLSGNTLREMQRVQWMDWDWGTARGLAFGVYRHKDRTLSGHAGDCPGFNTRLFLDPENKRAVAVLANRNRVDVDGYAHAIFDIAEAGGTPTENEPAAGRLDEYVGHYDSSPWDGEMLVFRWGEGLAITFLPTMNPLDKLVSLEHVEGDRFRTVRSNGQPGHPAVFQRDEEGRVRSLQMHSFAAPRL